MVPIWTRTLPKQKHLGDGDHPEYLWHWTDVRWIHSISPNLYDILVNVVLTITVSYGYIEVSPRGAIYPTASSTPEHFRIVIVPSYRVNTVYDRSPIDTAPPLLIDKIDNWIQFIQFIQFISDGSIMSWSLQSNFAIVRFFFLLFIFICVNSGIYQSS